MLLKLIWDNNILKDILCISSYRWEKCTKRRCVNQMVTRTSWRASLMLLRTINCYQRKRVTWLFKWHNYNVFMYIQIYLNRISLWHVELCNIPRPTEHILFIRSSITLYYVLCTAIQLRFMFISVINTTLSGVKEPCMYHRSDVRDGWRGLA